MSDEGMNLTKHEAAALAHLVVAHHIRDAESWLEWEDFPYLGQHAFERLTEAVRYLSREHSGVAEIWKWVNGVDTHELFDAATEGPEVAEHLGGRE